MRVGEALQRVRIIRVSDGGPEVERTVARECVTSCAPDASVALRAAHAGSVPPAGELWITATGVPAPGGSRTTDAGESLFFHMHPSGGIVLAASSACWLYPAFCLLAGELAGEDAEVLRHGLSITPTFPWLRDLSDFLVGSLRQARGMDADSYLRQIARQGFSRVTINSLGADRPYESGPPGDVYSWFYDYSPDLDQFVDSSLLRGYYPADYLQLNLARLKELAALARAYGLVPGLHINSPRSMPEEFWTRHGFLRGARVDHPRETLRPRYTLAMAHPVVQEHYRQLMRAVMAEVPELGFIHIWTNDSGAGFEFVSSLYAGRNGGPYLIREWKDSQEIARAAAANAMSYYRLVLEEGRRVNPAFRVVCDLGPFYEERQYLIPQLGGGIDVGSFAFFIDPAGESSASTEVSGLPPDVRVHSKVEVCHPNVPGFPFPQLVHERLQQALRGPGAAVLAGPVPESIVPYDINNEVVRWVQFFPGRPLTELLEACARRWAGVETAADMITAWEGADRAMRAYPSDIPCSTFGFPWFRFWVRPFVPDIEAIPEEERAYYERFLLATFNNPARIDLNNDMMWNFLSSDQARERKEQVDRQVLPPLDEAIALCARVRPPSRPADGTAIPGDAWHDLHLRLSTGRCFFATMRNSVAWTEAVHGYCAAGTAEDQARCLALCRAMVDNELENTRQLLALWEGADREIIPIAHRGESLHIHGAHFGEQLRRKIALMERHRNDTPRIDPGFIWRVPGQQRESV